MFSARYYAGDYFPRRYFPAVGGVIAAAIRQLCVLSLRVMPALKARTRIMPALNADSRTTPALKANTRTLCRD